MAFRRRGFRFLRRGRRRRRLPESYRLKSCRHCFNIYGDSPCTNPLTDVVELLTMRTPRNSADNTEVTNPSAKFITFDGIKFQSEYFHDPRTTQDCSNPNPTGNPNASHLSFILTIWEAIVILPLGQGSTAAPAYIPNFPAGIFQEGDTADRLLWKRLSYLSIVGINENPLVVSPNPDGTFRYQTSNPVVVVKSKARLDDRHGLYYVRQFVHDIFFNGSVPAIGCSGNLNCDNCDPDNQDVAECGVIPISNDFWGTMFYHTRG